MKMADKYFPIYIKCIECGESFLRTTKKKKYCSHTCGNRAYNRERQRILDEYKARKVAAE
jgi:predicted  nucleic acid-binding Zn-ribbon protein